jgi:hypothetical protein
MDNSRTDNVKNISSSEPQGEITEMPSELIMLAGGGISNFCQPIDPVVKIHDFPADWPGIVDRITGAKEDRGF